MTDWAEWSRDAVATMKARNQQWVSRFGLERAPYRWDLATAELCFERAADHVVADLCLVGTASEREGTFLWAWANDAIPTAAKLGLDAVRRFGTTHDLELLTTPEWALGFQIAGTVPAREPYVYASLQRDGVELMLLGLGGYQKPDLTALRPDGIWDAYVRMRGVHTFYSSIAGKSFIRMPLKKQPYGDWEFEVRDPNGYILVFSELIDQS